MPDVRVNKPFDLEGPKNCRELGGYPTKDGKVTRTHIFLRSDSLDQLTKSDEEFLLNYGLRLVVDLRGRFEAVGLHDRIDRKEIEYREVPLLDGLHTEFIHDELVAQDRDEIPKTMEGMYVLICEQEQPEIAKALHDLISFDDGCALFHCTAGKDRTGIISMLLLEIAGVPEDVIVADYAESAQDKSVQVKTEETIMEKFGGRFIPEGAFESKPSFMEYLINHLNITYGSVIEYLHQIGVDDDEMAALKQKFVTDPNDK